MAVSVEDVRTVWADVIGVRSVDPDINFFDLGGHSLLLIGLVGELNSRLSVDVDIMTIMEFPTVNTLCRAINSA